MSSGSVSNESRKRASLQHEVEELLQCPVCMHLMYPPIYQCLEGHPLCCDCMDRVSNHCPTCQQELGIIKCLVLQKMAKFLEVPCKFKPLGCQDIVPYYPKSNHENSCNYRPYACPFSSRINLCLVTSRINLCLVTGDIPHLFSHLKDDHKVNVYDGCTFKLDYLDLNLPQQTIAINCFGKQFCLHFEAFTIRKSQFFIAILQFMGEKEEASQFGYSLEIKGNRRKLSWEGVPISIRDSLKKVRDSQDGLIISMAMFISGGNQNSQSLETAGRIWKKNGLE